ncbi:MAG TPA: sporulation protein YqfD, partial [Bacillales bacterium]|nr:sporulation protein YqfD [Bacillales bacterium]
MNLFFGQVRIEVTGRRAEQFINRCLEKRVSISNITRTSETSIECTVPSTEVRAIRPVLRSSDCKLHIIGRKGLPFFIQHLSLKKGFVAGMILFAAVLFVLSNMLWSVDIEGADPKTEHQIKQVLNEL